MVKRASKEQRTFFIRSKIWIEDREGNVVFGLGRYRILKMIRRWGSMHAAAKELEFERAAKLRDQIKELKKLIVMEA